MDSAVGIVMEYCNLGSLKTLLLDKRIEIGLPLQVQLLLYIAKALACCHNLQGKRLIHVDVKPENILLAGFLVIKLCDFGSAEMSTWTELLTADHSTRSKKNRPQYTPYYTAPEKLKDLAMRPKKELDIYALGMIIYMFLTREMPYPRCNEEEWKSLRDAIKEGLRPNCEAILDWKQTLNDNDKKIAKALEVLMKECWHQNPSSRPSMMTICDRLQKILSQHRKSTIMHQAANVVEQMEEIYPPPTNLNQCLTLRHLLPGSTSRRESASGDSVSSDYAHTENKSQEQKSAEKVDRVPLIKKYTELIGKEEYTEASNTKTQISESFKGPEATAEVLKETGDKKEDEGKYLESILFYDLASKLFADRNDDEGVIGVESCAWAVNEACEGLLQTLPSPENEEIIRNHVIPLMDKMRIKMINMSNVDGGLSCVQEVWCLHRSECIQQLIRDDKSREETIKLGLERMEEKFHEDAGKYLVYGLLLHNLGNLCKEQNRLKESKDFYERAITSYKMATDFTEDQGKDWIEKCETSLRNVELKLRH